MKTAVLITVYNRAQALRACLKALALAPAGIDEAVVSDDGSDAEQAAAMKSWFAPMPFEVKYTRQEHAGYRLAAARNNAVRASSADYLISLDCDILPLPGAIAAHIEAARPGVFLAGDRAGLDREQSALFMESDFSARDLERAWAAADKSRLGRAHRKFLKNRLLRMLGLARRHKPKILGCHFSLFRADMERVNGFDANYVGWGLEDDDFAARLHKAGVKGRSLILGARAMHLWHESEASKPAGAAASPNAAYFRRRRLAARCENGLWRDAAPGSGCG